MSKIDGGEVPTLLSPNKNNHHKPKTIPLGKL